MVLMQTNSRFITVHFIPKLATDLHSKLDLIFLCIFLSKMIGYLKLKLSVHLKTLIKVDKSLLAIVPLEVDQIHQFRLQTIPLMM